MNAFFRACLLPALLAAPSAPAAAAAHVWVVAPQPGPGIDFSDLQLAINTVPSGDVLLLKGGNYATQSAVGVAGKSLTLAAELNSQVTLLRSLYVQGLAAGQSVIVRGLSIDSPGPAAAIVLANNHGLVWIDRCQAGVNSAGMGDGLRVERCDAVELSSLDLRGGAQAGGPAGAGLHVFLSKLSAHGCVARGGAGAPSTAALPGTDGAPGARVIGGQASFVSCSLSGGSGGDGSAFVGCGGAGNGGNGLLLGANNPDVAALGCTLGGGTGGQELFPCFGGLTGLPSAVQSGNLLTQSWPACELSSTSPVREGQTLGLSISGNPGEFVVLGLSSSPAWLPLGSLGDTLLLAPPWASFLLGTLPAAGLYSQTLGEIGPGLDGVGIVVQAALVSPLGAVRLSSPSPVLLLDANQ